MVYKKGHIPWNKGQSIILNTGRTHFKKGNPSWNAGKKRCFSKETTQKMRNAKLGHTPWNKGLKFPTKAKNTTSICPICNNAFKHKLSKKRTFCSKECQYENFKRIAAGNNWNIGRKHSEETNRKNSIGHIGVGSRNNHWNWQGGKSFEPYGPKFNNKLKEQIRARDQYRCQECFRHQSELRTKANRRYKLSIHHIDYDKKNNNPDNLISLCKGCHQQTNFKREDWTNYYYERLIRNG